MTDTERGPARDPPRQRARRDRPAQPTHAGTGLAPLGRVCVALRHPGLSYPNDALLREPGRVLAAAGVTLTTDIERSFACDLASADVAEQLLASLYVPDVGPARLAAARRVVRRWVGTRITTPIRLLVARASTTEFP